MAKCRWCGTDMRFYKKNHAYLDSIECEHSGEVSQETIKSIIASDPATKQLEYLVNRLSVIEKSFAELYEFIRKNSISHNDRLHDSNLKLEKLAEILEKGNLTRGPYR